MLQNMRMHALFTHVTILIVWYSMVAGFYLLDYSKISFTALGNVSSKI